MSRLTKDDLLRHGYDESKAISEWTLSDCEDAARFRGGALVSNEYNGAYNKLVWRCADGHEFEASPFAVLRAGHWCEKCCQPTPWDFDRLSKNNEFFAQAWYDSHEKDENVTYDLDENGNSVMRSFDK